MLVVPFTQSQFRYIYIWSSSFYLFGHPVSVLGPFLPHRYLSPTPTHGWFGSQDEENWTRVRALSAKTQMSNRSPDPRMSVRIAENLYFQGMSLDLQTLNCVVDSNLFIYLAKAPLSWGRMYDFCTFFRMGRRFASRSRQFFCLNKA